MSYALDNFYYDELKELYKFLESKKFGKIYDELNNKSTFVDTGESYCKEIIQKSSNSSIDEEIELNFCNNLYKVIVKVNNLNNDIFNEIDQNDKMYCFCLKYWLYYKMESTGPKGVQFDELFEKMQKDIKEKIRDGRPNPCAFKKLSSEKTDKLMNIYAFILLFYSNIRDFHEKKYIDCKYLNFFGKGLKAYYESFRDCSKNQRDDNYCQEFNELDKLYGLDKKYFETSKVYEKYTYDANNNAHCALNIESHNNPLHITYWYDEEKLHLSNQPIDFHKSTIISASSAIGTTVGISAFLFYLYKYTSLGSLFHSRMQKNNITYDNIDKTTSDFTLHNSDFEHTNFENSDYNITYYSLNNS
ncbi:PIR Superfamily Protein [Plasmodium ovale curtisi]|uniref:PIR Superfamily Protein n=1 Tax=Plasmodium ovale curtisi TaxID=864141 RepID=A0A1A8X641_PLAOA|nr:PIR Superfamily Protein [Plasmodium ovale curtisi]